MTEFLPRTPMGPGPVTVPSVSWFEFILNDRLLEQHLSQENPDPSPTQLIVQFLQQAEAEITNNINGSQIKEGNIQGQVTPNSSPVPLIQPLENGEPMEEDRKPELEAKIEEVPASLLQTLLVELMRITIPAGAETAKYSVVDLDSVSDEAAFAIQLYHRWCILAIVRDSFPIRPIKTFMQIPGPTDVLMTSMQSEVVIKTLREKSAISVENLLRCLNCGRMIRMPNFASMSLPSEDQAEPEFKWNQGDTIHPKEFVCQLSYDLGTFYFYQEAYTQALEMFKKTKEALAQLNVPVYCNIDAGRLNGYSVASSSFVGNDESLPTQIASLYDRAEECRRNDFKGFIDILIEDNLKQELSSSYRSDIEDDLASREDLTHLFIQVSICNVVRGVMEGKAFVSVIADVLEDADTTIMKFILRVLTVAMSGASYAQKTNLKYFVWHVTELASKKFIFMLLQSELMKYFTPEEVIELRELENEHIRSRNRSMYDDMTTVASSYPSSRDSSISMANLEHQLMYMYDPDIIRHLVFELISRQGKSPSQVMSLNEKWKVPFEILDILRKLPPSPEQAYAFILVGKACHCMEVKIFERARQLLGIADNVVADISYMLSKHIRWQVLLADHLQYLMNESFGENATLQDLIKKTKTCITTVRLGQDIQPSPDILEHCAAFLLNIRDWDYLFNMENTDSGHIELCRLLSCLCKELPSVKNARKPARDLWEAVVVIFSSNVQHKRLNSGRESAMYRDSQQGILSRDYFSQFLKKIKDPMATSVLVSCLTKLYNIIKDDITVEISSEYLSIWPTVLPNNNAIQVGALEEAVTILMQHAIQIHPTYASLLRTQADIYYAHSQYSAAMKFYMEAGAVASDFFANAVPKGIYDDQMYRKMMKCCSYLQCHTQVAVLCQFLDEIDYTAAFKALQEKTVYDAMDSYYVCIWDISILEYLVHLHSRRGEMEKRQAAMRAITQLDLNSNNPEDIIQRSVQIRKRKFLRALAKQYM
ncbi:hypothetical protein ACJMK2_008987 [Sinanodonta woodiana]|uniref:INTS8 TPR repeats domain-containing protein n=1 Tax=Sinanodonta woodiana TaxID=1069815 RepID=A0ABD3VAW2_SINWO